MNALEMRVRDLENQVREMQRMLARIPVIEAANERGPTYWFAKCSVDMLPDLTPRDPEETLKFEFCTASGTGNGTYHQVPSRTMLNDAGVLDGYFPAGTIFLIMLDPFDFKMVVVQPSACPTSE